MARLTWLTTTLCVALYGFGSGSASAAAGPDEERSSEAEVYEVAARPEGGWEKDVFPSFRTEYRVTQGYRSEELDWSIGIPTIDVLSELKWEEIRSTFTRLEATVMLPGRFYLQGEVQHGWIIDGENQDSDYLLPGRQAEFSRSNNQADVGDTAGFSVGLGYHTSPFHFWGESYRFGLSFGYAHREQHLVIRDGFQTIPAAGTVPQPAQQVRHALVRARGYRPRGGRSPRPYTRLILTGARSSTTSSVLRGGRGLEPAGGSGPSRRASNTTRTADGLVAQPRTSRRDIGEHLFVETGCRVGALLHRYGGDDISEFLERHAPPRSTSTRSTGRAFSAKLTCRRPPSSGTPATTARR